SASFPFPKNPVIFLPTLPALSALFAARSAVFVALSNLSAARSILSKNPCAFTCVAVRQNSISNDIQIAFIVFVFIVFKNVLVLIIRRGKFALSHRQEYVVSLQYSRESSFNAPFCQTGNVQCKT